MPFIDTADAKTAIGTISPRYLRRRANDDKAVSQHRRTFGTGESPVAKDGVSSCHYKRRVADDKATAATAAAVALAAQPPPPAVSKPCELPLSMDQATPELRRRIFEAGDTDPQERLFRPGARPVAAALSILLCFGVGALLIAL